MSRKKHTHLLELEGKRGTCWVIETKNLHLAWFLLSFHFFLVNDLLPGLVFSIAIQSAWNGIDLHMNILYICQSNTIENKNVKICQHNFS